MKKAYTLVGFAVLLICSSSVYSQQLISSEFLSETPAAANNDLSEVPQYYDVANYKIVYATTDTQGDSTIASGLLSIPVGTECAELPMAVYCHGTVLQKSNVPSSLNYEAGTVRQFASSGFIALGPDYIGFGESPGLHPYQHNVTQATATIDMIHAAREFLEGEDISDTHEVFVTGYSQGGHAAMATLMYAQQNGLTEDLGIVAGAPCSGSYDLSGTTGPPIIYEQLPYNFFGYVAFIMESYQLAYGNIYEDMNNFYDEAYVDLIPQFFDGEQDTYSMTYVNGQLPNSLSQLLVDSVVANVQGNLNHPIWQALEDNNNYDWAPEMPLRMYYCTGDEQVYYVNSTLAESTMQDNGAEDVEAINMLTGGSHGQCVNPSLNAAWAFFSGQTTLCWATSVEDIAEEPLEMFPNPTSDVLNVEFPESTGQLEMIDLRGATVLQQTINGSNANIDVSGLPAGQYVVKITSVSEVRIGNVVVE